MPFFAAKSHSTFSPASRHGFERWSCVLNLPPNSYNRFSLSRVPMAHSKTTGSQETFLQQVLCIITVPIYKRVYGYSQRRACSEAAPLLWSNMLDLFPVSSLIKGLQGNRNLFCTKSCQYSSRCNGIILLHIKVLLIKDLHCRHKVKCCFPLVQTNNSCQVCPLWLINNTAFWTVRCSINVLEYYLIPVACLGGSIAQYACRDGSLQKPSRMQHRSGHLRFGSHIPMQASGTAPAESTLPTTIKESNHAKFKLPSGPKTWVCDQIL